MIISENMLLLFKKIKLLLFSFNKGYGESFSDHSFCAFSSVISKDDSEENKKIYKGFIKPTFYEMICSSTSLTIKIYWQYFVCPRSGGYIHIEGNYEGDLLCPDYYLTF